VFGKSITIWCLILIALINHLPNLITCVQFIVQMNVRSEPKFTDTQFKSLLFCIISCINTYCPVVTLSTLTLKLESHALNQLAWEIKSKCEVKLGEVADSAPGIKWVQMTIYNVRLLWVMSSELTTDATSRWNESRWLPMWGHKNWCFESRMSAPFFEYLTEEEWDTHIFCRMMKPPPTTEDWIQSLLMKE
jgi:hypothetical protein